MTDGRVKLIALILVPLIAIAGIMLAVDRIKNAFSDTKINVVSASCETQERFVSILEKALSEVSGTLIEGEEFITYSDQAIDAVKKRDSLLKDSVYFVRLPDNVNVYVWFKTEKDVTAYAYKTK